MCRWGRCSHWTLWTTKISSLSSFIMSIKISPSVIWCSSLLTRTYWALEYVVPWKVALLDTTEFDEPSRRDETEYCILSLYSCGTKVTLSSTSSCGFSRLLVHHQKSAVTHLEMFHPSLRSQRCSWNLFYDGERRDYWMNSCSCSSMNSRQRDTAPCHCHLCVDEHEIATASNCQSCFRKAVAYIVEPGQELQTHKSLALYCMKLLSLAENKQMNKNWK